MTHAASKGAPVDFIEVVEGALDAAFCADVVARFQASDALQPGRVGGGVFPELKDSRDLSITGRAGWETIDQAIQSAVFRGLIAYVRRYPQAIIAPLMLQAALPDGRPHRLEANDIAAMSWASRRCGVPSGSAACNISGAMIACG